MGIRCCMRAMVWGLCLFTMYLGAGEKEAERVQWLRKEISRHDYLYYVKGTPEIKDAAYDRLYNELVGLETTNPDLITSFSPTQRVAGSPTPGFDHVTHDKPMLSLNKCTTPAELQTFDKTICHKLKRSAVSYMVEPKIDGLAISLLYKDGLFTQAITRGNGRVGDDVTANARTIRNLPLVLRGKHPAGHLEIRGEIYISKSAFKTLNRDRLRHSLEPFANPRNLAVGSLKLRDPREAAKRHLSIICYDIVSSKTVSTVTQETCLQTLQSLGLPTPPKAKLATSATEMIEAVESLCQHRTELPFQVDGAVIKVNDTTARITLGTGSRAPNWAIAYKFPPPGNRTRLLSILHQVGRTGVITPVAELQPVIINGNSISRASLHNYSEIERLGLHRGDWVSVQLRGDIIPAVDHVYADQRTGAEVKVTPPKTCPSCSGPISQPKTSVQLYCTNPNCAERQLQVLLFFSKTMEMNDIGPALLRKLYSASLIRTPPDLFALPVKNKAITAVEQKRLQAAIIKSRRLPAERVLCALGIRHIGPTTADRLLESFESIAALSQASRKALISLPGIGAATADSIISYFQSQAGKDQIKRLTTSGLQLTRKSNSKGTSIFTGTVCVITGSIPGFTRKQAEAFLTQNGAQIRSSVSRKTTLLIAGKKAGSKLRKAKELKIRIMQAAEFVKHAKK